MTQMAPPNIVLAPRTPTPPPPPPVDSQTPSVPQQDVSTHGRSQSHGLGIGTSPHSSASPRHSASQSSLSASYERGPPSPIKMLSPESAVIDAEEPPPTASTAYFSPSLSGDSNGGAAPFSFQPMSMAKSPVIKSNISARRGHKYKHSASHHSMSNFQFQETPARPALSLPASLPIPTWNECRASMIGDQKIRLYWSVAHMAVAGYVIWNKHSSAAMEALSHLIMYDGIGAMLCVFVEVWHNFEVWGRSSIRHPFGLQRMEVIAGFALSVLLIFFGFDLISHNAKHALEGLGSHQPHRSHSHHDRVGAGTVDFTVLLALVSTLISAVGLKNHARIGKAMRFTAMEKLPTALPLHGILSNPSHFLTLSCSTTMLLLPLLELHTYEMIDKLLSLSIAFAMLFLGMHLGKTVGGMLLLSYPGPGVNEVLKDIEQDPLVRKVDTAKFWQAHYGVGIANLKLRVGSVASEEGALVRLRERIVGLIRNRLSGGYGGGNGTGQKWEVSVEFEVDDSVGSYGHAGHHHHHYHHVTAIH
ncbi:cation diffusion zinc membrane transporter Zrg17 [Lithohypha guttulata]|nr:cation diffusion zinc membrane transporter Zrg17 [Lithohypha guttulata]